jgi:hypothetical protein
MAKSHKASYPLSLNKSTVPFDLIHSDVWGPAPVSTVSGIRWFVIFIDDCTRMTWLYLLKHKDEVLSVFQLFHTMVQTQFSAKVKILRTDNGGEFVNHQFQAYFKSQRLIHETSCPQTPQQNGWLSGKIVIFLKLLGLFSLELTCPVDIGVMMLPQLCISSIGCPPKSWILRLHYILSRPMYPYQRC